MSNRMGVAVLEFEYDHLCHIGNAADDTLAELARIAGSGATLSPTTTTPEAGGGTVPVATAPKPQPTPVPPVTLKRPAVHVETIEAPLAPVAEPQAPAGPNLQDLPQWAQATPETAPHFDFDLQSRLEEAFGTQVKAEGGVDDTIAFASPNVAAQPVAGSAEAFDEDALDAALSDELDRVLAAEMAETDVADDVDAYASPELKAKEGFEAELARMFQTHLDSEAEPVEQVVPTFPPAPQAQTKLPLTPDVTPVRSESGASLRAPVGGSPIHPSANLHDAVIVDPVFAESGSVIAPPMAARAAASGGRGKRVALAIAAVALLGGVAAVALGFVGGNSGPPPIIMAEEGPTKERPVNPGGENVPNQDQAVYKSVEGRSNAEIAQPALLESEETPLKVTKVRNVDGATSGPLAPRRVRTVTVRPDGTIVGVAPQKSTAAPAAPVEQAMMTLSEPEAGAPAVKVTEMTVPVNTVLPAPASEEPVEETAPASETVETTPKIERFTVPTAKPRPVAQQKPVRVARAEPKPAPQPASQPAPTVNSPYKVQISSQRSQAAAEKSYRSMARRFAGVIGGRGVDYQRTNIAGKGTYYRVRIPAQSRVEANAICSNLKRAGGSCFVTR